MPGSVSDHRKSQAVGNTRVERWDGARRETVRDPVVVEEPCEIRVGGRPVAVTMRTPGHDRELAAGFLFTEGIVDAGDIGVIDHCHDPDELHAENIVEVRLVPGRSPRRALERNFYASSSCGVCGKASIDAIHVDAPPVDSDLRVDRRQLPRMVARLRATQEVFEATGALHAAGLFDADGRLLVLREDVGRHNAVDKAVGHAYLTDRLPLDRHLLLVSGRTSFEIVQKALRARIPLVAGVSGVSSLAVDLASRSGLTLVGFLRGARMNVYAGAARIRQPARPPGEPWSPC